MNYEPKYYFTALTVRHANTKIGQQQVINEPVINDDELFEANQVINYIKGLK